MQMHTDRCRPAQPTIINCNLVMRGASFPNEITCRSKLTVAKIDYPLKYADTSQAGLTVLGIAGQVDDVEVGANSSAMAAAQQVLAAITATITAAFSEGCLLILLVLSIIMIL